MFVRFQGGWEVFLLVSPLWSLSREIHFTQHPKCPSSASTAMANTMARSNLERKGLDQLRSLQSVLRWKSGQELKHRPWRSEPPGLFSQRSYAIQGRLPWSDTTHSELDPPMSIKDRDLSLSEQQVTSSPLSLPPPSPAGIAPRRRFPLELKNPESGDPNP